jgi:hypothetical protein
VEVKSEAAFQRLLSSYAELPTQPRTPRSISDRGRYPEEAVREDQQREPSPSDDDGEYEETFAYMPSSVDTAGSGKAPSLSLNTNGDDMPVPESPSFAMDVDMVCGSASASNSGRSNVPLRSLCVLQCRVHRQITGDTHHHPLPAPCAPTNANVRFFVFEMIVY